MKGEGFYAIPWTDATLLVREVTRSGISVSATEAWFVPSVSGLMSCEPSKLSVYVSYPKIDIFLLAFPLRINL